jgi:DNA (cytosine-5)-methyltransferase 1
LRRLEASLPSKAITGGAQAEFIHPTEDRPLTIRECARLQTFPDTFAFAGRGTELIQQIGNAVPPLLGEQIARSLRRDLEHSLPKTTPGRLLSFHPTFADAMSPALQHVVDMVDSRFGSGSATYQANLWD